MSKIDDAWESLADAVAAADNAVQKRALKNIEEEAFRAAYWACAHGMGYMDFKMMNTGGMSDAQKDKMEDARNKQLRQAFVIASGISAYIGVLAAKADSLTIKTPGPDGVSTTLTKASVIVLPEQSDMVEILEERRNLVTSTAVMMSGFVMTEFGNDSYLTDD